MNKGFTLIELLGVLILLSIIALIAVPAVLGIISDSKEKATERSLDNYIVAVKVALSNYNTNNYLKDAECSIQTDGNLNCNGVILEISAKNTKPTSGIVVIRDYSVKDYYGININNKKFNSIVFNGTKVAATQSDTHKGIVYLDPTDLSATCNAALSDANLNEYNKPTGINSGCMKFYIYDDEGSTYKMILDHNTSGNVAWNSSGSNSSMNEVAVRLLEDTEGWVGNPRLITADEVAHIITADSIDSIQWAQSKTYKSSSALTDISTQNSWIFLDGSGNTYPGWQTQVANSTNKSRYAWLFENVYGCGSYGCYISDNNLYPYPQKDSLTTSTITGYWTSSITTGSSKAWYILRSGRLYSSNATSTDNTLGVRPVIEILKVLID